MIRPQGTAIRCTNHVVADTYARLVQLHSVLLGGVPTVRQEGLYRAYPSVLGFSSKEIDDALFQATLILALFQVGQDHPYGLHKVYFLAPAAITDGWVLDPFKDTAKHIFERLKTGKSVALVKHVGELFHQVMLGSQVFLLPQEPERWVSYGFSKSDSIPTWMQPKLLVYPEVQQQVSPAGV